MPSRRAGIALLIAGVALVLVGVVVGSPETTSIEGAFFTRAAGELDGAGILEATDRGLLDPADGNLWLGAGVALLVAGAAQLLLRARGRAG